MIGTVFLWMFWPSFNGALAVGNSQHRIVVNTVLALTASVFSTFVMSQLLQPHRKFSMVDIQNATLAGGVAVGLSSDLVIDPWGALLIGMIAGAVSVAGYVFLSPAMAKYLKLHDTCGVHNLHGMPGIIGGVGGVISAAIAGNTEYGESIGLVFPARADGNRSAGTQALYQLAALGCTLGFSIVGGLLTGAVLRLVTKLWNGSGLDGYFDDEEYWIVENCTCDDLPTCIHRHGEKGHPSPHGGGNSGKGSPADPYSAYPQPNLMQPPGPQQQQVTQRSWSATYHQQPPVPHASPAPFQI